MEKIQDVFLGGGDGGDLGLGGLLPLPLPEGLPVLDGPLGGGFLFAMSNSFG